MELLQQLCFPSLRRIFDRLIWYSRAGIGLLPLIIIGGGLGMGEKIAWGGPSSIQRPGLAKISTPKGSLIFAEIADSPDERAKGLMDRPSMASDQGMLFQFPELGYWTFWMKNTKIPLDILWLDKIGTIIHIESDVPICTRIDDHCPRYSSYKKSWQVLELNAGMSKKLELIPGNTLTISFPQNHVPY